VREPEIAHVSEAEHELLSRILVDLGVIAR
jgi:hypothetical protein